MQNKLKAGIRLERQYLFHDPVPCFPSRLNQVFMNVVNNAFDAMKGKGTLYISVTGSGRSVHVSFRDTGPGVPENNLPKLFNPGFTTKGVGVGTGLGLSICHQIVVESHHGRIWMENHADGGAVVHIDIPVMTAEAA
jgi:signal transduction histidine kinase